MYRAKKLLSKSTTQGLLQVSRPPSRRVVDKPTQYVRFESTGGLGGESKKVSIIWPTVAAGILVGGGVAIYAEWHTDFRDMLVDQFTSVYGSLWSTPADKKTSDEMSESVEEVDDVKEAIALDAVVVEESAVEDSSDSSKVVPVSVLDTFTPSQIDFVVGRAPSATGDDDSVVAVEEVCETAGEDTPEVVEEEVVVTSEVETTEEVIPEVELAQDEVAAPVAVVPVVETVIETVAEELASENVVADVVEDVNASVIPEESVSLISELPAEEPPAEVSLNKEQLLTVLRTARENLKIILDDAITTKTSAAGMLKGYLSRLGQDLLVGTNDSTTDEANSVLEHSIQESIDLVRAKEHELNLQVGYLSFFFFSLGSPWDSSQCIHSLL